MREKTIEQKLTKKIAETKRALALKFVSPGFAGMPDRLILTDDGKAFFAEIKAPGKKPTPLQESRHRLLRKMGFDVYVVSSLEEAVRLAQKIGGGESENKNQM